MEPAAGALLVLLLLAGPEAEPVGEALGAELRRLGAEGLVLVDGAAAPARLQDYGIEIEDLLVSRSIGAQLTRHQAQLVILHLTVGGIGGGDQVAELRIWLGGQAEAVTAIAGPTVAPTPADLVPSLLRGLQPLMPVLRGQSSSGTAAAGLPTADPAVLARAGRWSDILAAVAAAEPSPRTDYYRVIAYVRLGRNGPAAEALEQMRGRWGEHYLVASAASELPGLAREGQTPGQTPGPPDLSDEFESAAPEPGSQP